MPLVNCPECNGEVSQSAFDCPKCGHQLRKPRRSFLGRIIKWTFILFNIMMIWWILAGLVGVGEVMENASSDVERLGIGLGTGIALNWILNIWFFGDIILGLLVLLTRPSK